MQRKSTKSMVKGSEHVIKNLRRTLPLPAGLAALIAGCLPAAGHADALASYTVATAPAVTPAAADTYYCTPLANCTTSGTRALWATNYPVEIPALARALRNDADLIYLFVRNNVAVVPAYGLQKGALGALIDRSGTPFDQAQLLVELLRAAGYTANYVSGAVSLSATQVNGWLGTTNAAAIQGILADGGIPATVTPASGTVTNVTMAHVWVQATLGGTNYLFDPSLKAHNFVGGIDLAAAMGWDATAYLNAARAGMQSGTQSAPSDGNPNVNVSIPWVSNLNVAGSNAQLTTYATNLVNHLRTNGLATKPIEDVVGRQDIVAETQAPRQTTLSYALASPAQRTWTGHIPDVYRTKVTLEVVDLVTSAVRLSETLFADEVYGRQVYYDTFVTSNAWPNDSVRLMVDGVPVGNLYSGSDRADGRQEKVRLSIDHPYAANSGGYLDQGGANALVKRVDFISPVVIVLGFGETSARLPAKLTGEQAVDKLLPSTTYFQCGPNGCENPDRPDQPAGQTTSVRVAADWLAQYSRMAMLQSRMRSGVHVHHHSLGVAYRRSLVGVTDPNASPSSACGVCWSVAQGAFVLNVDTAVSVNSRFAAVFGRESLSRALSAAADTLEASQFEQATQTATPASVAHRFHWSSTNNASMKYYLLTQAATSGSLFPSGPFPYFYDSIYPHLQPYTAAGYKVIAAADQFTGPGRGCPGPGPCTDPQSALQFERGGAYFGYGSDLLSSAHIVSDARGEPLKGGSAGSPPSYQDEYAPNQSEGLIKDQFKDRTRDFGVDLASGDFAFSPAEDLSVGLGEFPYRLAFARSFRPGEAHSPGLGKGWTHNLDIRVAVSSDGMEAMGQSSPLAAASTLVALYATQQILGTVPGTDAGLLQRWIVAPLIQGWWAEQIRFNAVTHTAGSSSQTYVRLPNGKFLPPGAVLPADADPTSYWKLTQTGAPTGYGTKWEFDTVSFTLQSPAKDVQSFAYWKRTVRDNNRPHNFGQHIGWHATSWTWPKGVSLSFSYVPNDNTTWVNDHLAFVQNSLGRRLNFAFSPSSDWDSCRIQSVNDNGARTASFNCATNAVTSPAGDVSKVTYGASNCGIGTWPNRAVRPRCSPYLSEVFGASSATEPKIRLGYDAVGRVDTYFDAVAVVTPAQRPPYRFFIAEGIRGERKDPAGGSFVVDYDDRGRPVKTTDELGFTSTAEFDGLGRVVKRVTPEGVQREFAYDDARSSIKQVKTTPRTTVPVTSPANLTVNATYDPACGYVKTVTDARGGVTTWTYDQTKCTLTNVEQPTVFNGVTGSDAAPTTGYTYVASGLIDTITDPSGVTVDYGYDASGNRTSRTVNPGGLNVLTTYGYDGAGNITSVTNGNNHTTTYGYDGDRRVDLITAPTGTCQVTDNVWLGGLVTKVRLAKVCSPNFATDADWQVWTKSYTPTDRIDLETDPAGDTLDTDYDALDRVEYLRQSVGGGAPVRVTRTQYDAAGRTHREYRAVGTADEIVYAEYGYSPDGRQEWFKDARANLTDLDYDGYGRLLTTTFPDQSVEQLGYDDNGNVTSRRNRSGQVLTMAYDALDRETSRTVPDHPGVPGNFARTLTSTYDLASRPYDQSAEGQTLKSRYDSAGRLQRVEDTLLNGLGANVGNVEYSYDAASNRQTMLFRTAGATSWTQTYTYDNGERLYQLKDGTTVLAQYGYDPLARLTSLAYVDTSSAARTYEVDDDLATLTHTFNGGTLGFSYTSNGAGQLRTIATGNASLLVGPPAAPASYTPNLLNQYSAVEAASLTYDANGNLTGDGLWTYRYDEENRLRQATRPGMTADYAYDPQGRRRAKTVNGTTTYFISDGPNELAELNSAGTRQRFYLNGLGMDERVALHDDAGGSGWRFFHPNHQGSVVLTTLASTGGGIGSLVDYGAFGESTAIGSGNPIRYTGRYFDAESGLYYYRARYYAPSIGRFLQTDPIGIEDDINLYAYVDSDPLNNVDPSGQCESASICAAERDLISRASGQLSVEEFTVRRDARAAGVGIGTLALGSAVAALETVAVATSALAELGFGAAVASEAVATRLASAEAARLGQAAADLAIGTAQKVTQPKVVAAVMELGADNFAAGAALRNIAGAERVVELGKASVAQQEIRAAVTEAAELTRAAFEAIKRLPR